MNGIGDWRNSIDRCLSPSNRLQNMAYKVLFVIKVGEKLKEIGELLKEKRKENGVSIAEASEDLGLEESVLENMEEGNTRAFKDMYTLKELIKDYAKYLGMDVNDVLEEFNDFLFEHTSKISLDDIREAKAKLEETTERKVVSPYTQIPKKKIDYHKFIKPVLLFFILFLLLFLIFSYFKKEDKRSIELRESEEVVYELA